MFDFFETYKHYCLVLEYASGSDFFNILAENGRFDENEARFYFRQLIRALEYIHLNGIAHRDIKLENILLTSDNSLKLTDFGLSAKMKSGEFFHGFTGTLRYSDPEILKDKNYSPELSDIWSAGVILFSFLSGHLPYDDDCFG